PSPQELEELELLNRALEKALKVRKSISKTPLEAQGATGPGTAGKGSSKGAASKQGRSHRPATRASGREVCAAAEPQKTPGFSRSAPSEQQSCPIGGSAGERDSVAAGRQQFDAGKRSCSSLGESSRNENPAAGGVLGGSTSPRTVALQEQGCQLKLPLAYRKAYSRNSRAWEKCRLCHMSADAEAARKRFTERIQSTFHSPTPALSPAEIEEELKVLQDVPSLLSQYVEAEAADHPTLEREYESLLTLECLQTTVSQCLHKLQLLQADCTENPGSCAPARDQACSGAGTLAVPLLCYSSFQELRDLFALKLQVSMLHQEIALQKLTMTELLPVLDSRACPEASAAQLYRAIYTQLCEGGTRFPVLVRDELAD
ncbi:TEDC2 protein, partial [Penelope pileata]|nr:TEDC2 protein [Penelope pileata]